jgi:hypothetical protein
VKGYRGVIPKDYPEVLNPKHIQEILGIGRRQTYELLNQEPPPFHLVRVGRSIKVSKVLLLNGYWASHPPISSVELVIRERDDEYA